MNNIEKSEVVIARILSKLMEFGLQSADLKFQELDLDESFEPFFSTCIDWLESEGLIRMHEHIKLMNRTSIADGVVLTSYGFSVMGQKMGGTQEDIVVGDAVKQVSESQSGYSGVGDFIGGLLGGFTKSISS